MFSYEMLVNCENRLPEDFVPPSLAAPDIAFAADPSDEKRFLEVRAARHAKRLFDAAKAEGIFLYGISGYRSYERQEILYQKACCKSSAASSLCETAMPGCSEHQTGLAVDLSTSEIDYRNSSDFADTAAGRWVAENAHKFGFILRFPEDKTDITGYSYEPWHIRYVGLTAAADIYEENLTLEEYLEQLEL